MPLFNWNSKLLVVKAAGATGYLEVQGGELARDKWREDVQCRLAIGPSLRPEGADVRITDGNITEQFQGEGQYAV